MHAGYRARIHKKYKLFRISVYIYIYSIYIYTVLRDPPLYPAMLATCTASLDLLVGAESFFEVGSCCRARTSSLLVRDGQPDPFNTGQIDVASTTRSPTYPAS